MTGIYDELQITASELLGEFDQGGMKLIKMIPATGGTRDDPGKPTEKAYPLQGTARGAGFRAMTMGLAVKGDKEVTVAVLPGVTPTIKDFIEINGLRYKIVDMPETPAAGNQVAWKFIVRKGG